jgi:hypothetical protein
MAGKHESLPFERGQTASTGLATVDATVLDNLEGQEYVVDDVDPADGRHPHRPARPPAARAQQVSGIALLPKRLVSFKDRGRVYGSRVDGYADTTAEHSYPVDEYLPSTGVADSDLFYIVVEGPALVLTDLAGGANNVLNVGDVVVALTAATSGATTAGRVAPQDLTGATALLANQVRTRSAGL